MTTHDRTLYAAIILSALVGGLAAEVWAPLGIPVTLAIFCAILWRRIR